ncbi:uncharacterized protein HKW66_Vig0023530 [Vigna angularis]|uniref:Uncharacterized protein n=1 Tax=Phaseolus angularis TaxID=3914 RepID=A0A8T0L7N4_PHAAN|nr:uncharacterized protein HKW66_Vig0023530 [Vigna angularis]
MKSFDTVTAQEPPSSSVALKASVSRYDPGIFFFLGGTVLLIILLILLFIFWRRTKGPAKVNTTLTCQQHGQMEFISGNLRTISYFDFRTLSRATKNFHPRNLLGSGGFGPVYQPHADLRPAMSEIVALLTFKVEMVAKPIRPTFVHRRRVMDDENHSWGAISSSEPSTTAVASLLFWFYFYPALSVVQRIGTSGNESFVFYSDVVAIARQMSVAVAFHRRSVRPAVIFILDRTNLSSENGKSSNLDGSDLMEETLEETLGEEILEDANPVEVEVKVEH